MIFDDTQKKTTFQNQTEFSDKNIFSLKMHAKKNCLRRIKNNKKYIYTI